LEKRIDGSQGHPTKEALNEKQESAKPPSEEYQRFEKLAKALIAVPKSEIEKREAEYQ
jgi:hypothetical protein